jgi:hypothetical protein
MNLNPADKVMLASFQTIYGQAEQGFMIFGEGQ